jgi:hypothetical protein
LLVWYLIKSGTQRTSFKVERVRENFLHLFFDL